MMHPGHPGLRPPGYQNYAGDQQEQYRQQMKREMNDPNQGWLGETASGGDGVPG